MKPSLKLVQDEETVPVKDYRYWLDSRGLPRGTWVVSEDRRHVRAPAVSDGTALSSATRIEPRSGSRPSGLQSTGAGEVA